MSENKSKRNKTLDFSIEEAEPYLKRCVKAQNLKKKVPLNKTILGDTFAVLKTLPEKFVSLLIADPPYNLSKYFGSNYFAERNEEEYIEYTENWVKLILPCLKDNASVYVCCDWKCSSAIERVLAKYFTIQNRITWQREKGRGAKNNWKNSMEDVYFCTVGKDYIFNLDAVKQRKKVIAPYKENGKPKDWEQTKEGAFRLTCPSNFWSDISVPYWSMAENTTHPTQKPEKLIAKIILASSNEKDIVLDPFLGSGTTSVVAKKLNRNYVGIEQNPLYCAYAEKRLLDADTDKTIQGYKDGVFWERNSRPDKES